MDSRERLLCRRILVVEDEPLIGMAIETALADTRAQVVWTQTDRSAYQILGAQGARFDPLIADINLREGTTGYDVARFARRVDPGLSVIYISGERPDALGAFGVDGAVYLTKPFREAALVSTAAGLIRAQSSIDCPMPRPV